ncbi:peptidoglycan DD-metalloendopeptidase family protein [Congregibacter sp.]|uniref:peptidoglycan DD-metalloendopeptidase family protein n=1 Tax=Congregibacter sp. TaxID=2744308 RepID=UPI003F6B0989
MTRIAQALVLFTLAAQLVSCADKPLAPIEDRSRGGTARVEQRYTVLRGDTLFSIAFRYGLDFRRLAAANAIAAPFTIYPGQTLQLVETDPPRAAAKVAPAKEPGQSSEPGARAPAAATPRTTTASVAVSSSTPAAKRTAATAAPTTKTAQPRATVAGTNIKVGNWRWPVRGRVVRRFEKNLHKGLDISGNRGDPVQATAGGQVVYAGSGIAGYGLMLIVRHNDEYLSAYGHNDALLVGEGDVVRAGQKIAERGSSGTDSVKLHFEIRRQGRPVDPLKLLPSR